MNLLAALKASTLFKGLEDREIDEVLKIARETRFPKDSLIMEEGEEGDTLYMVLEGELDVSKSLTMKFGDDDFRTTDKVLTRIRPQDHEVLGEMALICRDKRSASVMARTDCRLIEIRRDDFIRLVEENPRLGVKILLNLSELLIGRLRQSSEDVVKLTTALSIALSK
ncbi:MAG: cyclic nucleotide-binding domain-containing protein [Deltaproteobacteria bacterium]|nr:cyclic nucleotide-binding domain-containing protein [Deltaproteobacteria bacterium]MBW2128152.1 cyclic nucleotide-binding domain-containing protein [Deltaproteobacteria bacterium]MBW2302833.1 cyclic nucleotide-binding domain-containing protein [Deltaproteobacteria bacterium]